MKQILTPSLSQPLDSLFVYTNYLIIYFVMNKDTNCHS